VAMERDAGATPARDLRGRAVIAGLFTDRDEAVAAIEDLKAAGFRPEDVGVAMRDRTAQGELVEDTGTKAAEGAAAGAVGGGALGALVGFLVGLGALAIPGIGPVVAGGALATAFGLAGGTAVAGAGIGAAAGGIVGALVGMGIPEEEARYFERGFREGGVLVTVTGRDRAPEALRILERHGADTGAGLRSRDAAG
jgi:Heat induced stress protein YflT